MQEKQAVLRLQNQNSSTRERAVLKSKKFASFRGKKKTLSSIKNKKTPNPFWTPMQDNIVG